MVKRADRDLMTQLEEVRDLRGSRPRRHRAEIVPLAAAGVSNYDLALWLCQHKHIKVHTTTVWRVLRRWSLPLLYQFIVLPPSTGNTKPLM